MSRTPGMRAVVTVGLVGLLAGTLITAYARADTWGKRGAPGAAVLLGAVLPALTLQSLDGKPVLLADRLARGPSLVIVLGARDCFSCSSYQLELRILKSKLPGLAPILVGSGGDASLFRDYFRKEHLEAVALLDPDRSLLASVGVGSEPLVLLVDSAGRVLFVDNRPSAAAAQFPFGRLLPLLGGALQTVPPSTLKSGEPN
jgi:hypothetical protein